jgi:putative ABC transport system permease protein
MAVYLRDVSDVPSYAHDLEARLRARGLSVSAFSYDDERISPVFVGAHAFLMVMASFMGTIVFLVVVLSIINSMTMTILERTREIGTFRSLGFTRRNMMGLFLRESVILTAVGVAVGLTFALIVCLAVNTANLRFSPPGIAGDMQFKLEPNALLCIALAVVMIALSTVATALTVRGRIKMKVAELNTAVTG